MPRHRPSSSARGASSAKGASHRRLRVGEMLRHTLADILRRNEIRDPDLISVSVTVTEIKPSPDMRHATVYVEPLGGEKAGQVVAALNRHRGFLRGQLGREIDMKFTPELRFVEDTTFAEAERIARLLHSEKVARDLQARADEASEEGDGKKT